MLSAAPSLHLQPGIPRNAKCCLLKCLISQHYQHCDGWLSLFHECSSLSRQWQQQQTCARHWSPQQPQCMGKRAGMGQPPGGNDRAHEELTTSTSWEDVSAILLSSCQTKDAPRPSRCAAHLPPPPCNSSLVWGLSTPSLPPPSLKSPLESTGFTSAFSL